jgi:hypothetical protein
MARKIFKKVGLRRDNNLGDLSNSTEALNNLLDTLVDSGNFISEDLDCIRGIYSAGLDNVGYSQIAGSAVQTTDSSGINVAFSPRITYQNRLDRFKAFSGEPRFNGGNGLSASYFNQNQVFENTVGIFSGTPVKTDNFWELGNFQYSGKLTPESVDVNGGVQWEGYFIPTQTGVYNFYINSSACFTFDFETQGYVSGVGTYTEINRIGLTSSLSASGTSDSNQITLTTASNTKFVGVGQSVSGVGIYTGSVVASIDRTTGIIALNPPTGITANTVTATFTNQNKTFFKIIGQNTAISHSTYILNAQQRYRVRARYYIPSSIDAIAVQRNINFDYTAPTGGLTNLRYTSLYSLDYDFSDAAKGEFPIFIDNSIRPGGGTLGGVLSNNYVKVKSLKKVDIKYQPKTNLAGIVKSTINGTITVNSNIVTLSNTSNLEIGNYVYDGGVLSGVVFGQFIPTGTTIIGININNSIVLSQNANGSGTVDLTFIEHRGFVKRLQGSASTSTFTLSSGDTTDLKSGMILIGATTQAYTGITTTSSTSTFTIDPSQSLGASTYYVYQSRGLVNESLNAFCNRTITKCLVVAAPGAGIGTNIIPVVDSTGVSNGWSVQGFYFAPGTTVNGAPGAGSITLDPNTPTIRALVAGANFTVTGDSGDRQLCCPPTDTSPPFTATLDGLDTVSAAPSLRIESGNVVFNSLKAVVSSSNITPYSSSNTSTSRISIQTPIGTYKILCA